ncbi:MAG: hypothetical protein JW741_27340 [Sedimentisphaerales bacterium]|nr:hypothetical protein [Sedimentisphaerales bacterium]
MDKRRNSGLTVGELVFLLVVCVFFLALLVPVLRRRRSVAVRPICGSNLCAIGKAMLIYANDYEEELPRAGGVDGCWNARIPDWTAMDQYAAFGTQRDSHQGGRASISASLYLLVKYCELTPKSLLCNHDKGVTEFKPGLYRLRGRALDTLWDFGPDPPKHCSYAYHMVYSPHKPTVHGDPGFAVAADRNPWIDSPFRQARAFSGFKPNIPPYNGTRDEARGGNAVTHSEDGQNVLFLDSHASFEMRSFCALDDDNIYTSWDGQDKARGTPPVVGSQPADPNDSLLVNDPALPRP